jgi:hypothetical protein
MSETKRRNNHALVYIFQMKPSRFYSEKREVKE